MITFNELKEMQPRLGQLEAHAITLGKSSLSYIQRDRVWYQGLKDEMAEEITVKLNISLDATKIEITEIELIEGELTGEVDSFLSILKGVFESGDI